MTRGKSKTTTRRRKRGMFSAEAMRQQLAAWCVAHGGVAETVQIPKGHVFDDGSVASKLYAATYRLPSKIGPWTVHLPEDSDILLSINTRFTEASKDVLPSEANPYSGKWNHNANEPWVGEEAAEELLTRFLRLAAQYTVEPTPACAREMGCLCWAHAHGAPADAPCNATEPRTPQAAEPPHFADEHEVEATRDALDQFIANNDLELEEMTPRQRENHEAAERLLARLNARLAALAEVRS